MISSASPNDAADQLVDGRDIVNQAHDGPRSRCRRRYDQLPQRQSDLAKDTRLSLYSTARDAPIGSAWSNRTADTLAIARGQCS